MTTKFFALVRNVIEAEGVSALPRRSIAYLNRHFIGFAYQQWVRPFIPAREPIFCAGFLTCHDVKWGDNIVPKSWVPKFADRNDPDYENTLIEGLRDSVRLGDKIVVIGGGLGVTATVAALRTGPSGSVECFEATAHYARLARETVARNHINNVTVHHAVIAKTIQAYGTGRDLGMVLPPSQLPTCDVLQMDCEGAEIDILRELTIQPRVILVETHGMYGAPTELVASLLRKRGYVVSYRGAAEPQYADFCMKNDVQVLLGTLEVA